MPDADAPKTLPVEITLDRASFGSVIVDGVDLSDFVRAVHYSAEVGELSCLVIELTAEMKINAEAEVLIKRLPQEPNGTIGETTSVRDKYRRYARVV